MMLTHDAQESDKSAVSTMQAADQSLDAGADASTGIDSPSFLEDVYECERLLNAVWPSNGALAHEVPRQFGRFLIVRELGRGGFGIVFLAEDLRLRRRVALKVPRPEVMVTTDFRRRFLREAEAASRLAHPHIVQVYDVGQEGPFCFIVSAYCEGPTLAQWLRGRTSPVPIRVAARLVAVLAAAVAHAHDRDILHRDLKPGNILLERPDALTSASEGADQSLGFVPRICDFGLAKLLDQSSQETCSGVPIGSASYMAPEQAAGRLREHGPATDVYALGAILFELLTGPPPFRGETDLETLSLVIGQEPPSPRALRPGLPRDLETIVLKCLEKRPIRRYTTASELTADLQRFLDGKPVHARPAPPWEHAAKWVKRRPVHAALAVVIVLVLSSVFCLLIWSSAWLRWHQEDKRDAVVAAEAMEHELSTQLSDRSAYGSKIKLIHEQFELGNVGLAALMLDDHHATANRPELDGFVWNYVRQLFQPDVTQLDQTRNDHTAIVKLAISPDGRTLAGGTSDGRVFVWDLVSGQLRHSFVHTSLPENPVYHMTFSHDGRYLATVVPPGSVKIWDMATLEERGAISVASEGVSTRHFDVFAVRFTEAADFLATFTRGPGFADFAVCFWSVPARGEQPKLKGIVDRTELRRLGATGPPTDPSWVPARERNEPWLTFARNHLVVLDDGVTFAIKDTERDATLMGPRYYTQIAHIHGPLKVPAIQEPPAVAFTPAEVQELSARARRVVGCDDGKDPLWIRPVDHVAFAPDGRTAAVHLGGLHLGGLGIVLIDVATNRTLLTNVPARWRVVDLAFTPDGRTLVTAGFNSQIHVWHLKPNALGGHSSEVWSLAFSPDGKSLASGAADATIKLWDVAAGQERTTLKGHGAPVTAVAYSPDGTLVASASFDHDIRLWNAATGEHAGTLRGHLDRVRALAFSPDGKTIASAGNDCVIRLWDVNTGSELTAPLTGHSDWVFSLAFAPDGKTLYSGGRDKAIMLWDWQRGRRRGIWRAEDEVYSLAVSPDSQMLAVGHHLGKVKLWDVTRGKSRASLAGHTGDVLAVTFSPDGLTLASTGGDQTIRLWDPVTAQELLTLKGHQAPVHAASFSPDGTILATGSHDGAIKLWRAPKSPIRKIDIQH